MKQHGVFVTGTDTNVGKTWVGQHIIRQLVHQGVDVAPRKPIESGWVNTQKTDAYTLATAANKVEQLDIICPKRLTAALSPVSAAALEGKVYTINEGIDDCLAEVDQSQFLYIEGAGGFYSPLYSDGLNADLAQRLALPILLVAEDKLGCINHILLTIAAIESRNLSLIAVLLNQTCLRDSAEIMDNTRELKSLISTPIIPINYQQTVLPNNLITKLYKK